MFGRSDDQPVQYAAGLNYQYFRLVRREMGGLWYGAYPRILARTSFHCRARRFDRILRSIKTIIIVQLITLPTLGTIVYNYG